MRVCAPTRKQAGKAPSREFEQRFFNDQVLILDNMFVRRLTGIEGKDGNPLNEVRVLCNSILLNQGKLPLTSSLVAELCRLGYQAPAGKSLLIKTQGRRGGQADRSRLCAALRGFFRRDREEVLVRGAGLCDGADKGEESGQQVFVQPLSSRTTNW